MSTVCCTQNVAMCCKLHRQLRAAMQISGMYLILP